MRQLVTEYSNVKQLDSGLKKDNTSNIKQLVSQVPWMHNVLILQKVKDIKARIYYLKSTISNRFSRTTTCAKRLNLLQGWEGA